MYVCGVCGVGVCVVGVFVCVVFVNMRVLFVGVCCGCGSFVWVVCCLCVFVVCVRVSVRVWCGIVCECVMWLVCLFVGCV